MLEIIGVVGAAALIIPSVCTCAVFPACGGVTRLRLEYSNRVPAGFSRFEAQVRLSPACNCYRRFEADPSPLL